MNTRASTAESTSSPTMGAARGARRGGVRRRLAIATSLVLPVAVAVPSAAPAAAAALTMYVAEGGTDSDNCTVAANPCAKVSHALRQGGEGSTINVSGTIVDNINITYSVTITGAGAPTGSPAVIDGSAREPVAIIWGGSVTLDHLVIRNGANGEGGGIVSTTPEDVTLSNVTVTGNTAYSRGGGLWIRNSTVTMINSTFSDNTADDGGGVHLASAATLNVYNSTISGNRAMTWVGGGIAVSYQSRGLLVSDSTISGNSAATEGGGIFALNTRIVRSTITGNSAPLGGGVHVPPGELARIIQSTVSGNTASTSGSAIYNEEGWVTLSATILGPNTGPNCGGSSFRSEGYNINADTSCPSLRHGTDLNNTDAQLGPLQDNGGPTLTMRPAAAGPAADRVPPNTTLDDHPACPRTDQRGVTGPIAPMTQCTVGALETSAQNAPQPALAVTSTSGLFGTPYPLTSSGGLGSGAVTFTVSNGTATGCVVSGSAPHTLSSTTRGTCMVTATKAGDANFLPSSSTSTAVNLANAQAALNVTSTSGTYGTPLPLTTSGGSGTGAVTFRALDGSAGGCVVSGSTPYTLSADSTGTCNVTAVKAADPDFVAVSSAPTTVWFAKAAQAQLTVTSTSGLYQTPLTLTTSGGSHAGPVTYTAADGTATGCAVSDSAPYTLSSTSVGTCIVTASKEGSFSYLPVSSAPTTVTIATSGVSQPPLTVTSTSGTYLTPLTLTTSGGAGTGALTYTAVDGTATGCAVSNSAPYTLSSTSGGTCTVTATTAGDANYLAASSPPTTVTIGKLLQAELIVTWTRGAWGDPLTLTTSGGSGTGNVEYVNYSSRCTESGIDTLTADSAGDCWVRAFKDGDASYFGAISDPAIIIFQKRAQEPLVITSPTSGIPRVNVPLTTSGGSGTGRVEYATVNEGCIVNNSGDEYVLRYTQGDCWVQAFKDGDANYGSMTSESVKVVFGEQQAPLIVTSTSGTYGTDLPLTTSGGSGLGERRFTVAAGTASGCALAPSGVDLVTTSPGTCIVTATKAEDSHYLATSSEPTTVTIDKAAQTSLTVVPGSGSVATPIELFTIGGTGTGALTYTASEGTAAGCTVSGSGPYILSVTSSGTCIVTATKAGDDNYLPETSAPTTMTFQKLLQATLVVTSSTEGTFGTPLLLTSSGGSGTGEVTYSATDNTGGDTGCLVSAAAPYTLSTTKPGICDVRADKAGDGTYHPIFSSSVRVTFAKLAQAELFVTSNSGTFGTPLPLTSSGGSGTGYVRYAAADGTATGCAVISLRLSATSAGTCTVTATKDADATFTAVSSAPTTVTLAKKAQAPLVVISTSATFGTPLTLATSGGSGTGAVTYTVVNGSATGCAVSAEAPFTLSSATTGTCMVTATKAADAGHEAASSPPTTVTLRTMTQASLIVTSTSGTFGDPLTLTTSGGSGTGGVTYTAVNGTAGGCAVSAASPSTLSSTGAGTCTVTATKAGDSVFEQISSVPTAVALGKAAQAELVVTSMSGDSGTPLTLTTSGGSGTGAVTFTAANGTATGCAVSVSTPYRLSSTSLGTCIVTATKATDANYLAASSAPATVTLATGVQAALTVTSTSGTFGTPLALTTSGGSGTGAVTYTVTSGSATGCAVSESAPFTLSSTSTGSCMVTATKEGDSYYEPVSSAPTAVTLSVGAITMYVAAGGSNTSNNCAVAATPCATVSHALTYGGAGSTVNVSGTIADRFTITYAVTITGANAPAGSPAVIDGSAGGTVVTITGGPVTLHHLVIRNGSGTNGGGGISTATAQRLTVSNSTVTANAAATYGGGLYLSGGGETTITNSTVSDNTAASGGGVYVSLNGVLYVYGSTVSGNRALTSHGGAIFTFNTTVGILVADSTISGNRADSGDGGGVYNGNGQILRSTLTGNSASRGGGAYVPSGVLRIIQSTLAGNTATNGGAGVFKSSGTLKLSASIFGSGGGCFGSTQSVGYNIGADATCGLAQPTDLSNTDPQLGALQDNGGPTFTMLPSPTGPAADRIPANTTLDNYPACTRTDQRGTAGPVAPLTKCTVGAVEASAAASTFSINDVTLAEGASGTTAFTFTITRSGPTTTAASVDWSTRDGSAQSPSDYTGVTATTVTFDVGDTTKTVSVTVNGDTSIEPNDGFTVDLANPVGATVADGTGVGRITNDDKAAFSIDDVTVTEGNAGTSLATFTVSRTGSTDGAATVQWRTLDSKAKGGTDYVAVPLTTLAFAGGVTSQTVSVSVIGETVVEPAEDLLVRLSSPTGGHTIADATGVGTITTDDLASSVRVNSFAVSDATVTEGNSGTTLATFTVSRTGDTSQAASVQWRTMAGTASAGEDFVAVVPTVVNFAGAETSKTVAVTINGDTVVEANETLLVRLGSPEGATVADGSGLGRITNDDTATFSVNDATVTEGHAGTKLATFTVTRAGAGTGGTATVRWSTADGTATAGSGDYVAVAASMLTFGPGETTKSVSVTVNGDTRSEANETFQVTLAGPAGAGLGDASGLGRITNDD